MTEKDVLAELEAVRDALRSMTQSLAAPMLADRLTAAIDRLRAERTTIDEVLLAYDKRFEAMQDTIAERDREIAALKETNARLNRRCQLAEAAANEKVKASRGSFGRMLANYEASRLTMEVAALKEAKGPGLTGAERDAIQHAIDRWYRYADGAEAEVLRALLARTASRTETEA